MSDSSPKTTWPAVVAEAAKASGLSLPPTTQRGMGSVLWRNPGSNRFVSFRPLLGTPPDRRDGKAHWALWHDDGGQTRSVLVFHLPLRPVAEQVPQVASVLRGWLFEHWSDEVARQQVTAFAVVEVPPEVPVQATREYWLCENHGFGVILGGDGWEMRAGTQSLSTWKSKSDGSRGRWLSWEQLDRLCGWLARHWHVLAYGKEPRPPRLRERGVAACRAYEDARIDAPPAELEELQSWWDRHALRAADSELPNVFLERQGDEVIISWDESPSATRSFMIPYGAEITGARFAVPALRRLVASRIANVDIEPKFKRRATAVDAEVGYRALGSTFPSLTLQWLNAHRFSDEDARDMALTGTAAHPVVGLLRSAQGSVLSLADLDIILALLQPNVGTRFQGVRSLAKGMNAHIDLREPWQSGYHLARLVRAELGQQESGYADIEATVRGLGIDVRDVSLTDPTILAACVGSPQFAPLIALNVTCPDAAGQSGRRITLAHELCHLLFDRSRMQSFARFEGGAAQSDRLIEMRANAFAVELLAPIRSFVRADGTLMTEEEAEELSTHLQVSTVAIRRHVRNQRHEQRRVRYELV